MRGSYRTNIIHVVDFNTPQRILILSASLLGTIPDQRSSTAKLNLMPPQIPNHISEPSLVNLTRLGILDIHIIPIGVIALGRFSRSVSSIVVFTHEGANTAAGVSESVSQAFLIVAGACDLFAWCEAGVWVDSIDLVLEIDHGADPAEGTQWAASIVDAIDRSFDEGGWCRDGMDGAEGKESSKHDA